MDKPEPFISLASTDDVTSHQSWLPSTGLPDQFRIDVEMLLVTFEACLGLDPSYIAEMWTLLVEA